MEEQAVAPVEATVEVNPDNLTDEQMDQYFDTQGESLETPEPESSEEKEVIDSQSDEEDGRSSVDKPNPKDDRTVPLAALHQERQKRQEQDRKLQVLAQRLEALQQAAMPKPEPEPEIDVNENPIEYFNRENQKLKEQLEQINGFHQAQAQTVQQQQSVEKFKQVYANAAKEYAQQQQDFPEAYHHLVSSRMEELQAMGYDQQRAAQIAERDEAQFVIKAFNDGVNPAERIYNLAKMRGYNQQPQAKPEVDLDTIEKGVKASRSVGSMKGSPPVGVTLEALADMSDEEFEKNFDKIMRQT